MAWYAIEKELISIKIFYFLALSAIASLLPYLPIFLLQLGNNPQEIGIIYSLSFFITFVKNPLVGFFADKYQIHKIILIVSCVLTGSLYCVLLVVPSTPSQTSSHAFYCFNVDAISSPFNLSRCMSNSSLNCGDNGVMCDPFHLDPNRICSTSCRIGNSSDLALNKSDMYDVMGELVVCDVSYDCVLPLYKSLTFWLCLTVVLAAALSGSNELMLNDAIGLSILGEKKSNWGKSRCMGSLGYGITTISVSLLIDRLGDSESSKPEVNIDYTPAFYVYLALSLASGVVAIFHSTRRTVKSCQVFKGLTNIFKDWRIVSFLILLLFIGILNGIHMTYAYIYLRQVLNASQLCLGSCVFITVLVEIPTLFIGGKIVEKIGSMNCLYLASLAYCVRFIALVHIRWPWWAVLIETTHLFTFGLMFTAAIMYASQSSTESTLGTMIGLVNGINWGLGLGIGSLVGSNLYGAYGYNVLFKGTAVVAVFIPIIHWIVTLALNSTCCCSKQTLKSAKDDDTISKVAPGCEELGPDEPTTSSSDINSNLLIDDSGITEHSGDLDDNHVMSTTPLRNSSK